MVDLALSRWNQVREELIGWYGLLMEKGLLSTGI